MSTTTDQRQYEILNVLGRGGFGTVYRARLRSGGGFTKEVALKVLNPELASSEEVVQRLRDEARMLGLLRHRAIVHVDGLARLSDRWTIIMEFVDGASVRELMRLGPMPVSVALEVTEEVATALQIAYEYEGPRGDALHLLHRDIKPGNIQVTAAGEVKLLDFGVARAEFGQREAETRSLIFGSLNYLAPERMDFEDTHKGDIYALGCTLYEMLVGEQLDKGSIHPRKHRERVTAARKTVLQSTGDSALADLVATTLAYEPDERPDARSLARTCRDLRRAYPEPWTRDWAEKAVPKARDARPDTRDDWSGSIVGEASGALTVPPNTPAGAAVPENRAAPKGSRRLEPAPARNDTVRQAFDAPAPPRRRRRSAWRWVMGALITVVTLGLLLLVGTVVVGGGGLYALLSWTGLWESAWNDTVVDSMIELEPQIASCQPGPERDALLSRIQALQDPVRARTIGFMELVSFETTAEAAAEDGIIQAGEWSQLKSQLDRFEAD